MQKNLIISLITGQLVALLPLWDWGDKLHIPDRKYMHNDRGHDSDHMAGR